MSFEPNYEKVVSNYKRKVGEMQSQLMCKLPCMEGEEPAKILSANVCLNMLNGSANANVINFDGVSKVQVLYMTANNECKAIDYTLEFKDRYTSNKEIDAVELCYNFEVVDVRAVIESGSIKVEAILNIVIDGIFADNLNILVSAIGDGVYTKYEDVKYSSLVGVASERFDTSNDVEINDVVDSVLCVSPCVTLDKVEANESYVKVYGVVNATVTYLTAGERPAIRTIDSVFDFTQECALTGTTDESIISSQISCMYQNVGITTNLGQDKTIVNLIVPIEYKGYVWNEKSIQMVSDIYSTTNEVKMESQSYIVQTNHMPMNFAERINGNVTIDDNDPLIDEVLGTCFSRVVIANARINGDILVVDGVASTNVIYRNNEMEKTTSVDVQIPFSVDLKVGEVATDNNICVMASITKMQVKARRGTDIELSAEMSFNVSVCSLDKDAVISSVVLGDEKVLSDTNLIIYVAKDGDTIWEIAKEMSVSEDVILAQNPNLELPIEAGSRIVVYKQLVAKM